MTELKQKKNAVILLQPVQCLLSQQPNNPKKKQTMKTGLYAAAVFFSTFLLCIHHCSVCVDVFWFHASWHSLVYFLLQFWISPLLHLSSFSILHEIKLWRKDHKYRVEFLYFYSPELVFTVEVNCQKRSDVFTVWMMKRVGTLTKWLLKSPWWVEQVFSNLCGWWAATRV